jgi:hypothetical protein
MLKKYSRVFVSSRLYPQSDVVGYDGKIGLGGKIESSPEGRVVHQQY